MLLGHISITRINLLNKLNIFQVQVIRGAAGRWREMNALPRRYQSPSPLSDSPEWSYVDGRGFGPLSRRQLARHKRHQRWASEIIRVMNQMKTAKELVPEASDVGRFTPEDSVVRPYSLRTK